MILATLLLVSSVSGPAAGVTSPRCEGEIRIFRRDSGAQLTAADLETFFNRSRCERAVPLRIEADVSQDCRAADPDVMVAAGACWAGQDIDLTAPACLVLHGPRRGSDIASTVVITADLDGAPLTSRTLMDGGCAGVDSARRQLSLLVRRGGDAGWRSPASIPYVVDTSPPRAPRGRSIRSGAGQVQVRFDAQVAGAPDLRGYQVLCQEVDDPHAAPASTRAIPGFHAAARQCETAEPGNQPASGGIAPCDRFVCSPVVSTARPVTVTGLRNETSYRFWVVAIDSAGNPGAPALIGESTPRRLDVGCAVRPGDGRIEGWWLVLPILSLLAAAILISRRW